jgi:hypothetical protein
MKKYLSIIVFVFLFSCGGGVASIYETDYPLSKEIAYSKTSNLYVNLPSGWFTAEDNEYNCTDLWIVKDDYSESIAFKKINLDDDVLKEIGGTGLDKITFYSKTFARVKLGKDFKNFYNEEFFEINGKTFAAYEYLNKNQIPVRVVLFRQYDKYYESEAISKDADIIHELFKIQNTVLSTLK